MGSHHVTVINYIVTRIVHGRDKLRIRWEVCLSSNDSYLGSDVGYLNGMSWSFGSLTNGRSFRRFTLLRHNSQLLCWSWCRDLMTLDQHRHNQFSIDALTGLPLDAQARACRFMLKRSKGFSLRVEQVSSSITAAGNLTISFPLYLCFHILHNIHGRIYLTYTHLLKRVFLLTTLIISLKVNVFVNSHVLSHKALLLFLTLKLYIQYHRLVFWIVLRQRIASFF